MSVLYVIERYKSQDERKDYNELSTSGNREKMAKILG